MPSKEVIDMIMSGKHYEQIAAEEVDDYPEKLQRAAVSLDVPEWVRRAAARTIEIAARRNVPIKKVTFEDVGLGLHDNIVESAVIGGEGERFYRIVCNFEEAIKNMRGF